MAIGSLDFLVEGDETFHAAERGNIGQSYRLARIVTDSYTIEEGVTLGSLLVRLKGTCPLSVPGPWRIDCVL